MSVVVVDLVVILGLCVLVFAVLWAVCFAWMFRLNIPAEKQLTIHHFLFRLSENIDIQAVD